jgi:hypothetical protein
MPSIEARDQDWMMIVDELQEETREQSVSFTPKSMAVIRHSVVVGLLLTVAACCSSICLEARARGIHLSNL